MHMMRWCTHIPWRNPPDYTKCKQLHGVR